MFIEWMLIAAILLVLFALLTSTEKVLHSRENHVVIDERMIDHRSRL